MPPRVETAARAYLVRSGINPDDCRGDIVGSNKKSITTSVACSKVGLGLDVIRGSYDVVETDRHTF